MTTFDLVVLVAGIIVALLVNLAVVQWAYRRTDRRLAAAERMIVGLPRILEDRRRRFG